MPGGQPWTYLQPPLGRANGVSNLDPTPLYPFGHGLSYTTFAWEDRCGDVPADLPTDGETDLAVTVRNTGDRAGAEVVQLYLHDPVAQTTRPEVRLIGYARVALAPGESRKVSFRFHPDLVVLHRGRRAPDRRARRPGAAPRHLQRPGRRQAHRTAASHRA